MHAHSADNGNERVTEHFLNVQLVSGPFTMPAGESVTLADRKL
jgi:hypothetical protein